MARDGERPRAEGSAQRLRRGGLYLLFALVLLIPRTLALRRRPRAWNALRAGTALGGVLLVVAWLAGPLGGLAAAAGVAVVLLALLVPPVHHIRGVTEKAEELGALVVVNGGHFERPGSKPVAARLFVGPERVTALDLEHKLLLEIPFASVSSIRAEPAKGGWKLRIAAGSISVEFSYSGFFAEHLARVAESTLLSRVRRELPVLRSDSTAAEPATEEMRAAGSGTDPGE